MLTFFPVTMGLFLGSLLRILSPDATSSDSNSAPFLGPPRGMGKSRMLSCPLIRKDHGPYFILGV